MGFGAILSILLFLALAMAVCESGGTDGLGFTLVGFFQGHRPGILVFRGSGGCVSALVPTRGLHDIESLPAQRRGHLEHLASMMKTKCKLVGRTSQGASKPMCKYTCTLNDRSRKQTSTEQNGLSSALCMSLDAAAPEHSA